MFNKVYCRSFQAVFNVGAGLMKWPRPEVISGPGSIEKIPELLNKENVKNVMIVTGPSIGKKLAPKICGIISVQMVSYLKIFTQTIAIMPVFMIKNHFKNSEKKAFIIC